MEQADNLLLHSLVSLQIPGFPKSITSIVDITPQILVSTIVNILNMIRKDPHNRKHYDIPDIPDKLPENTAARFKLCSRLAKTIQRLGYQEQIGYHQFLYPTDSSTRSLLQWILEQLPHDEKESDISRISDIPQVSFIKHFKITTASQVHWQNRIGTSFGYKQNTFLFQNFVHRQRRSSKYGEPSPLSAFIPPVENPQVDYKNTGFISLSNPSAPSAPSTTESPSNNNDIVPIHQFRNSIEILADATLKYYETPISENITPFTKDYELNSWDWSNKYSTILTVSNPRQDHTLASIMHEISNDYKNNSPNLFPKSILSNSALCFTMSEIDTSHNENRADLSEAIQKAKERNKIEREQRELRKKQREEEIETIQGRIRILEDAIKKFSDSENSFRTQFESQSLLLTSLTERKQDLEDKLKVLLMIQKLLPQAETNLGRLESSFEARSNSLAALAEKWDSIRIPLLNSIRSAKIHAHQNLSVIDSQRDEIADMKSEMRTIITSVRDRSAKVMEMQKKLENMNKDVDRSFYTSRILDIVKNIRHQKDEIVRILSDIKTIKKSLSSIASDLSSTYSDTENLLWSKIEQARKKLDDAASVASTPRSTWGRSKQKTNVPADEYRIFVDAYKYLNRIHESFSEMVVCVQETANNSESSRDLTASNLALSSENTTLNLSKIKDDLHNIQNEISRLKSSASSHAGSDTGSVAH